MAEQRPLNAPKLIEFRGQCDYFLDGKEYKIRDYREGAIKIYGKNAPDYQTIKGRLFRRNYCTPYELRPVSLFGQNKGYTKEMREKVLQTPRLETRSERTMDKYLRIKI